MDQGAVTDLGGMYRAVRERLTTLVLSLSGAHFDAQVPTCPAWTVGDVLAHLVASPEDVLAGRLSDIPSEEFTAGQVARFAGVPHDDRLARWAAAAPQFEQIISAFEIWPAVIDVASHEQDIRGAVGRPGGRDSAPIRACTRMLLSSLEVPVPLRVVTEDDEYIAGPAPRKAGNEPVPADEPELALVTSQFEAFRWRMGRRSRAQMSTMAWSGDPTAVLDHLVVFGPADSDIIE